MPPFHQPPTNRFKQSFHLQVRCQADTVSWPEPWASSSETDLGAESGSCPMQVSTLAERWWRQSMYDCVLQKGMLGCTRPCTIMSTSTACSKSVNTTSYHWQMKFLQQQSDVTSLPSACDQAACWTDYCQAVECTAVDAWWADDHLDNCFHHANY